MAEYPLYDGRLPRVDEATSGAAADSIPDKGASLREKVLAFVKARGEVGATCDEVEHDLKMLHTTASARIRELSQMGRLLIAVDDKGKMVTRPTRSNRAARVYVAAVIAPRQLEFFGDGGKR